MVTCQQWPGGIYDATVKLVDMTCTSLVAPSPGDRVKQPPHSSPDPARGTTLQLLRHVLVLRVIIHSSENEVHADTTVITLSTWNPEKFISRLFRCERIHAVKKRLGVVITGKLL